MLVGLPTNEMMIDMHEAAHALRVVYDEMLMRMREADHVLMMVKMRVTAHVFIKCMWCMRLLMLRKVSYE